MIVRICVVVSYLAVLLAIGLLARRSARPGWADYFVASRTTSPVILFLTMAATNFSAFTVFGFAGAGWESGYSFYPIMAFGTGFMALTFVLIGRPVQQWGKALGCITPPQLVGAITGSGVLRALFFVVMTAFTLPYLAMQPMAGGYALQSMLGIPYFAGAALITGIMLVYTFLGGFRGVAWTDAFQGGLMITLLLVAVAAIARELGGLTVANQAAAEAQPALFARPGLGDIYTPGVWFGYMALWFLCDPMFPQLFQRFFAARDGRALTTTMALYPLLTGFLFLLPVTIGVLGRLTFPELPSGASADQILPLMLSRHTPPIVEALVLTAALAALMSTLDSQLLTLSSMFAQDVCEPLRARMGRKARSGDIPPLPTWVAKVFVVSLALAGLAIAYRPPETFRVLATQTFTGLAVLFPTMVGALYWRRMTAWAGVASIVAGEGLLVAHQMGWLPSLGTLPVVPVVAVSCVVLIGVSLIPGQTARPRPAVRVSTLTRKARLGWTLAFLALFAVANDGWNWGSARAWILGYPWWVWMFAGLCLLSAGMLWRFGRAWDEAQR